MKKVPTGKNCEACICAWILSKYISPCSPSLLVSADVLVFFFLFLNKGGGPCSVCTLLNHQLMYLYDVHWTETQGKLSSEGEIKGRESWPSLPRNTPAGNGRSTSAPSPLSIFLLTTKTEREMVGKPKRQDLFSRW